MTWLETSQELFADYNICCLMWCGWGLRGELKKLVAMEYGKVVLF